MNKIAKVSKKFRVSFQVLFYLIPILVLWFWIIFHGKYDIFTQLGIGTNLVSGMITVNLLTRILGVIASIIPLGVIMYCLRQLINLFRNYENGQIFILNNVKLYRKLGYVLFAWVIGDLIFSALITFILTFQNPPHHRLISVSFGSTDIVALITGGIVLLISWVMKEAHKISEEQRLTV